ncbi:MAG: helix-turn-helix domain-containing protein [Plesiomonas sp.]|uniref:helix-turn-helix domain-containing protein n=3 Tax=Plesiomonas sp. TaxID=2486279 RepID=UPI003F3C3B30
MAQEAIVRELLYWIETNLSKSLSIDDIANRAGYSKWHLQRMFKDITGHAMGAYLRARRLTRSAHDLRSTNRSILDIALHYCFDSQQTFTRAFKSQFGRTPAQYRRLEEWDCSGLQPPLLNVHNKTLPVPEFVELPALALQGSTVTYSVSYRRDGTLKPRALLQHWQRFRSKFTEEIPPNFFALISGKQTKSNDDEQELYCTCAVESEFAPEDAKFTQHEFPAGKYAKFTYYGSFRNLTEFIVHLYCDVVPLYKLTRRGGYDVEQFPTVREDHLGFGIIRCDYYIPIKEIPEAEVITHGAQHYDIVEKLITLRQQLSDGIS